MSKGTQEYDIIFIGGGAASFFASIVCAEKNPTLKIAILERGKEVLQKVRISGGGRCNVTNACFDPKELILNYPRGKKELLGSFYQFNCQDTITWFNERGVQLKTEADGRMFPITDNSETIAQCLIQSAIKAKVKIITSCRVDNITKTANGWELSTVNGPFLSKKLFIGAGSSNAVWDILARLGHQIIPAVPSLFTFNIKDKLLHELAGVSVSKTSLSVYPSVKKKEAIITTGPILFTHWGLSGPAILKSSAWGARILNSCNYIFDIYINWLYPMNVIEVLEYLSKLKSSESSKKQVNTHSPFSQIPLRLWKYLLGRILTYNNNKNWADLNKKEISSIADILANCMFKVNGKSTFKEEFVTAGGVSLKDINLKTFESKIVPSLYFGGEILDVDAITGGFNFQAAWTGGYLAGIVMGNSIK